MKATAQKSQQKTCPLQASGKGAPAVEDARRGAGVLRQGRGRTGLAWAVVLLVVLSLLSACTRSPEAQMARHLDRGDRYFKQEKYREAVIEYQNALRIDPRSAHAARQTGLAHFNLGELGQAYRYLLSAQELDPANAEVRLKLGAILLLGGRAEEARGHAEWVLERQPNSLDALVLAAAAAQTREEVEAALQRLERVRADFEGQAKYHLTLGTLHLRLQDAAMAEVAFKAAVAREPRSVEAHLALGNFYTSRGDTAQAERSFKTASELAPVGSPARIRLADFYLLLRNPDEARRILTEVTDKAPDFLPAWRRLAELAFAERKWDESVKALDAVLKKSPQDLDARFLRGRVHLALRETTQAMQEFQRVLKAEPRLAPARYQLAVAHLQAGNLQQARAELREAIAVAPNYVEAALLLAELNLQAGAPQAAIEDLTGLLARQPGALGAYVMLGSAHLANRDPAKATEAYRHFAERAPKDPRGPYLLGVSLASQGRLADARKEQEASLALAPAFAEPLGQLVRIAFAERKPEVALERVRKQIGRVPSSGALHFLLGQVHQARAEMRPAEEAYLKAIELEPRLTGPYLQLGQLYAQEGRYEPALAKLDAALSVNPRNVGTLMLIGVTNQRRGDTARAREAFEKILAENPRFAPAANNLAWILAEQGGDQERALQLAQLAKELAPDEGAVSDTLGWILYRRGVYQRALALLKEGATKLPDNPEVQYHLGVAAAKTGDRELARKALTLAVAGRSEFSGKDEARKALAELK